MKLKLLLLTAFITTLNTFSQTTFEPGYIILNNGTKTNCLIKNEDWKGSPKTFEYKFEENGEVKLGSIESITELASGTSFKYVRATLEVDQSTDVVNNLTDTRNPIMKEETLFLKTLAEGKASLYYTEKENIKRYFLKIDDGKIEQLIYKRYLVNRIKMGKNEYYKQQLATTLTCGELNNKDFENLGYKANKLINIITKYNSCVNSETLVYNEQKSKASFNLSLRPGVTFSSLSIKRGDNEKVNFEDKTGFRIGLEAEYIFPFNNGKWSMFVEPTYRNYSSEIDYKYVDFLTFEKITRVTAVYNSIEVPAGFRHYMFLKTNAALFIDAGILVDISLLDTKIESSDEATYDIDVNSAVGFALGFGFKYNNKYSLQARYHSARNITQDYKYINSSYNSFSLLVGYNFL